MDYYPQNTVAQCTTKLNGQIELDGEWEVGLTEISFPFDVDNVLERECYFVVNNPEYVDSSLNITLAAGYYGTFEELSTGLHDAQVLRIAHVTSIHRVPVRFSFDTERNRVKMTVLVYCDLVEHVPVGDTKAPLLRIVNRMSERGVHETFNPPLYIPLQKRCFDTVEINLMTDTGLPIPFRFGKSFVVLEFRRAAYKYFAI